LLEDVGAKLGREGISPRITYNELSIVGISAANINMSICTFILTSSLCLQVEMKEKYVWCNLFVVATPTSKPVVKPKIQVAVSGANVANTTVKVEPNDVPSGVKRKRDDDDYDALD
jgi:hypothetical protein